MPADRSESAAFGRAVLPHLDAAYNLARWLVRDAVLAEDVVQDVMLRALTYFASARGDNPRAWLLRIVRTVAYDRLTTLPRSTWVPLDDNLPDGADGPEAALAQVERHASLAQALEALPPELREAIVLRELEELSYRDIATVTGVPVGTVMSRLWRARQALRHYGEAQVS